MREFETPFASLGNHLRFVREQAKRSLAEVSGAVEIDEDYLKRIEAGVERPDEDVLLLLISYLGVKDREAVKLWESANYEGDLPDEIKPDVELAQLANKAVVMLLATDQRTAYSDGVEVTATPAGVTLSFTQGHGKQRLVISRVGMSSQQAESVVKAIQEAMIRSRYLGETKLLPPSTETTA